MKAIKLLKVLRGNPFVWYTKSHLPTKLQKTLKSLSFWLDISGFPKGLRSIVDFWHTHSKEIETLSIEPSFLAGLLSEILATKEVEGDIIELGAYKGGSTVMMVYTLKSTGQKKRIFTCDTFSGHPYDDDFSLRIAGKGEFSDTSSQYVADKFKRFHVSDRITICPGLFEDTLMKKLADKRFSLAFIDCDLYSSTKYALEFLSPRMAANGRIVLHDYEDEFWGLTKAVDEWCAKEGKKVTYNSFGVPVIEFS